MVGDPQFVGLRGQSYQVHGLDGGVYSLVSDALVQLSGRFTFLGADATYPCLTDPATGQPLYVCWSHPGSYVSAVALHTNADGRLLVEAGGAAQGFASVLVDGAQLAVGGEAVLAISNTSHSLVTIRRSDVRTISIEHAGVYSLTLQNSASFVNIVSLQVDDWPQLTSSVQSSGLLGQTWRPYRAGKQVRCIEGAVDDYLLSDMHACDDVYNRHQC